MIDLTALLAAASTTTTTVANAAHKSSGSILDPIAKPIAWLLAEIYSVIPNYGIAIMLLSVIWMLIIAPLTLKSTRSMLAMQKLQPQLKRLQEQHKDDRQAFAQAQMELFREHQVSPFGSCLPLILPFPVFIALFRVIDGLSHTVKGVTAPKYLSESTRMYHDIVAAHGKIVAFGMDLSKSALSHHGSFIAALPFYILLLIMAGTSYVQSAQMMSRNPQAQANPQMKMMKYIGPLFALICIRFPAGVVLYYTTSNICRIIQQDAMYRFDPKVKALVATEVAEVEEITQEIDDRQVNRKGYTPPRGAKPEPAKSQPPAKQGKTPAKSGRSRFAEMLASAQEDQRRKQQAKDTAKSGDAGNGQTQPARNQTGSQPDSTKSTPKAQGSGQRNTSGNGSAKTGGTARGQTGGNRGQPRSGGRTNRKRRGK
jgi:YidC/Oxa1 family membrane protein insertase